MKPFMDKDFLLETETAKRLFHEIAAPQPLVDYHCHISPREIYENRRFHDLTEVWLGGKQSDGSYFGDHYKWRVMRSNGVSEDYITGDRPAYERYMKFVEALQLAIGNPMVHWCNLELRQFFGVDKPLTPENAKEIWDICSDKLQNDPSLTVRGIIEKANVAFIGTTDDPVDSLEWHEKLAADTSLRVKVCPSFRPDKAINILKPGFAAYIGALARSVGRDSLPTAADVCAALVERLEFFKKLGCRASDHGLDYVPFRPADEKQVEAVFAKAMRGEAIGTEEAEQYQTAVLLHLGRAYHRLNIAMQFHYSCYRNANERLFASLGPDTGFDMIAQTSCGVQIAQLLSALDKTGECPKTILYSLNGVDNDMLGTLAGCFQSDETPGKIQVGSAWWFMDTRDGMKAQLRSLANLGLLGNFIGMLTDSRSFLSYARHDYFRRIFCNLIGKWVENGEFPNDDKALRRIVEGVSYRNAARYFDL
ncbi:MAG: glucuronate isomerase [Oscillospiraceae bacterium]|nr:glucuronate isomerase [Oscillospiraceae bacterium]